MTKRKTTCTSPANNQTKSDALKEKVIEIEVERLKTFRNHPFKVQNDLEMEELMSSIKHYGILNPILVTPTSDGFYQIISGHRRKYCAEQLGHRKVPVLIRVMQEEESIISMVDSNMHREHILFSEKAFAYKMKHEALKKKRMRDKHTLDGMVESAKHIQSADKLSIEVGESRRQALRYIRLTELIPPLLERLDHGHLAFNPAVDLSYLQKEEQKWVFEAMELYQTSPSLSQSRRLKMASQDGKLTLELVRRIMGEDKSVTAGKIQFRTDQLSRYFPRDYSAIQIKEEILKLVKERYGGQEYV